MIVSKKNIGVTPGRERRCLHGGVLVPHSEGNTGKENNMNSANHKSDEEGRPASKLGKTLLFENDGDLTGRN